MFNKQNPFSTKFIITFMKKGYLGMTKASTDYIQLEFERMTTKKRNKILLKLYRILIS